MSNYDDIINMLHHISTSRPRMSLANRAAQFSPFAALSGYDAAIAETGRLTDRRIDLDENAIADLDMKLSILGEMIDAHPGATITYFKPDEKKTGGAYVTATGALKKIDDIDHVIVYMDGQRIPINDILTIESEYLAAY